MTEAGAKNIKKDWLTFCDTGCVRNGSQLFEDAEDRRDQNRVTEFASGICDNNFGPEDEDLGRSSRSNATNV